MNKKFLIEYAAGIRPSPLIMDYPQKNLNSIMLNRINAAVKVGLRLQ